MVAGSWYNADGLYLTYGTGKPVPDLGGSYLAYGETRIIEAYVSLAATTFGNPTTGSNVQVGALPSSFVGNSSAAIGALQALSAGIQSLNTMVPLQTIAPIVSATAGQGLLLNQENIWWDRIEFETLVPSNTGSGTVAVGLTGIGLVGSLSQGATTLTGGIAQFVQITPQTGLQIMGSVPSAAMSANSKVTFWPSGSTGSATNNSMLPNASTTTAAFLSNTIVGPIWMGNLPLVTNGQTNPSWTSPQNPSGVIPWGYISAIASGGQYTGSTAAGLVKVRIFWNKYGTINQ
jgi:hypothetical protein